MLGGLRIRRRSPRRIELALSRLTALAGWAVSVLAVVAGAWLWGRIPLAGVVAGVLAVGGAVVATMRHDLAFDRDDGVLRIDERLAGFPRHAVVPLFHLKAVVVRARPDGGGYVAMVERRVGEPIVLDTHDHPGPLYALARAVSEVAGLRLVYDATTRAAQS